MPRIVLRESLSFQLKFLFTLLITMFTGLGGAKPLIQDHQFPALMIIYGVSFVSIYSVFALMWINGHRQRESLDLNEIERFDTRSVIACNGLLIAIGLISITLALGRSMHFIFASGVTYWSIGPAMGIFWTINGRWRRPLEEKMKAEALPQESLPED